FCRGRRAASTARATSGSRTPPPRQTCGRRSTAWRPFSPGSDRDGAGPVPSVADVLIEGLAAAGARRLFGVPAGGSTGALLRSAAARGLPVVAVHSALAACVMAAVSGELGEGPGAAAVESAPAALSGLAHARRDRAPMILLTEPGGSRSVLGDALAKQSLRVGTDSASREIAHAAELAMAEPRGPVHLVLARAAAERIAVPGRATV